VAGAVAGSVEETPAPTALELKTLRDLQPRTKAAHDSIAKRSKGA
jgi:glutaconate CoA-transferase subunit B